MGEPALKMPVLENGDCLNQKEFHQRYETYPKQLKAELVEGIVYMPSPVKPHHAQPHALIMGWLFSYYAVTPDILLYDNATLILDADNEVQPDAMLCRSPAYGGGVQINAEGYLQGAPELAVEISASSVSYDMHQKRRIYQRNGVLEYLVWQIREQHLAWFYLEQGEYRELQADAEGLLHSRVFPGLVLEESAFLNNNPARILQVLQQAALKK